MEDYPAVEPGMREVFVGSRVIRAFVFPLSTPSPPSPLLHLQQSRTDRKLVWFIALIAWVKHDGDEWLFEVNLMKSGSGSYLKQITAFTNISFSVSLRQEEAG